LGWTYIEDGDTKQATAEINAGFAIARTLENTDLQALAYAWKARISTQQEDFAAAAGLIQSALGMRTSRWIWYRVNMAAGDLSYAEGNFERALQFYQTAANQAEDYGGEEGYQIETRLGLAWTGIGNLDEAERHFKRIVGLAQIYIGQLHAKGGLALVAAKRGDFAQAETLANEVLNSLGTRSMSSQLFRMLNSTVTSPASTRLDTQQDDPTSKRASP